MGFVVRIGPTPGFHQFVGALDDSKLMSSPADAVLLDPEVLEQLARNTSADKLPAMLELFVCELDQRAHTVRQLLAEGALEAVSNEAHTVKGLAGSFGALRLQVIAFELERAGRGAKDAVIGDLGERFFECVEQTLDCYRARADNG